MSKKKTDREIVLDLLDRAGVRLSNVAVDVTDVRAKAAEGSEVWFSFDDTGALVGLRGVASWSDLDD